MAFGKRRKEASEYLKRRDLDMYEGPSPSNAEVWLTAYLPLEKFFKKKLASAPINYDDISLEWYKGYPIFVKETCDRCQKEITPTGQRVLKPLVNNKADENFIPMFLESCQCKDCINCTIVDQYLYDTYGKEPPPWKDARQVFTTFGGEYEKAWRIVIANAPKILMTEEEWNHRVEFFGGCAFCGGPVETRGYFFPRRLNGDFAPWNVIPLCGNCIDSHYKGRDKMKGATHRYRVFSIPHVFTKYKTIRLYLLAQMAYHKIWMEPLIPHRKRFLETKTLKGSRLDGIYGSAKEVEEALNECE